MTGRLFNSKDALQIVDCIKPFPLPSGLREQKWLMTLTMVDTYNFPDVEQWMETLHNFGPPAFGVEWRGSGALGGRAFGNSAHERA